MTKQSFNCRHTALCGVRKRKNVKAASLCNHEVLHLLNILKEEPQEQNAPPNSQLATIFYETSHFLQDSGYAEQNSSVITNALLALKAFPVALTKEEKLMIVNYPPTTNLQLSLIVRDADERLTEEQTQELLNLIKTHLLPDQDSNSFNSTQSESTSLTVDPRTGCE